MYYKNSWEKYVGNRMIQQGFVVCLLLLFIYDNMPIYYTILSILTGLICLKLITLYKNEEMNSKTKYLFSIYTLFLAVAVFLFFQYQNWLYIIMDNGFSQFYYQFDLSIDFITTWKIIFEYFGILSIVSFIIEFSVVIYYYYSPIRISPEDMNKTPTLFEYFLTDRSAKKWFLLISLLVFASIYEEIVYRYFYINLFIFIMGIFIIPIVPSIYVSILLASFLFGMAHRENGGWSYVINSLFAGIIFSLCFIWYGIITSWILHLLWNMLIILQQLVTILWKEKMNRK